MLPFSASSRLPLFVTLQKGGGLRGCIGTLSPQPLSVLRDYVHSSAFHDRRFEALKEDELKSGIDLSVSLLVAYEDVAYCLDWVVGTHGIIIKTEIDSVRYSATFLPEVATEQGWTTEETVHSLLRKAGFTGPVTADVLQAISTTRYQSSKFKLSYADYLVARS